MGLKSFFKKLFGSSVEEVSETATKVEEKNYAKYFNTATSVPPVVEKVQEVANEKAVEKKVVEKKVTAREIKARVRPEKQTETVKPVSQKDSKVKTLKKKSEKKNES